MGFGLWGSGSWDIGVAIRGDSQFERNHEANERFAQVRQLRLENVVRTRGEHSQAEGEIGELTNSLTHEPYASIDSYLEKLGRYSKWWAEDRFDRGKRTTPASALVRSRLRFASMYVLKLGFLDGEAGFMLAMLASTSVMMKYARLWEMQKRGGK